MAIKMVREPSETPNINNIDDIVPMRYAYGGQNGYVIGKGTEISNTVNGLNFTVNSGRLVLQGVECDIDATGVTITIDNIATKRYYTVYLEVNLGLNTATIKSEYDTATYPTIDAGDDLTENTTGVARLPLYQFTATSGIISEVNKVVESIKYVNQDFIKKVKVNDASKVNNLEIKQDKNGVLKIGNVIIPQKKVLWSGEEIISSNNLPTITLNEQIHLGDIIRIKANKQLFDFEVFYTDPDRLTSIEYFAFSPPYPSGRFGFVWFYNISFYGLYDNSNTLTFSEIGQSSSILLPIANGENVKTSGNPAYIDSIITEISKIIE